MWERHLAAPPCGGEAGDEGRGGGGGARSARSLLESGLEAPPTRPGYRLQVTGCSLRSTAARQHPAPGRGLFPVTRNPSPVNRHVGAASCRDHLRRRGGRRGSGGGGRCALRAQLSASGLEAPPTIESSGRRVSGDERSGLQLAGHGVQSPSPVTRLPPLRRLRRRPRAASRAGARPGRRRGPRRGRSRARRRGPSGHGPGCCSAPKDAWPPRGAARPRRGRPAAPPPGRC